MKARIKFRKYGALRFIGHLDVMRYFQKVMRRADIPIAFTGGYSPHMIMSFASPLGIGLTSDGEYFDIELAAPVDTKEAVRRMNEAGVEGIEVVSFRMISDEKKMTGMTILAAADYVVTAASEDLPAAVPGQMLSGIPAGQADRRCGNWKEVFSSFMEQKEIRIVKQTKRSEREVDIRPMIYDFRILPDGIFLKLAAGSSENLKPDLVMEAFCRYCGIPETPFLFHFHRLEMYADTGKEGERSLVTLEDLGWESPGEKQPGEDIE